MWPFLKQGKKKDKNKYKGSRGLQEIGHNTEVCNLEDDGDATGQEDKQSKVLGSHQEGHPQRDGEGNEEETQRKQASTPPDRQQLTPGIKKKWHKKGKIHGSWCTVWISWE